MAALRARGRLTPTPFDEDLEWSFYRLWHQEGRRARMDASMQGPDYPQWHGLFEVAERFYFDSLPKAEEVARGDPEVVRLVRGILDSPEHAWKKGMSPEGGSASTPSTAGATAGAMSAGGFSRSGRVPARSGFFGTGSRQRGETSGRMSDIHGTSGDEVRGQRASGGGGRPDGPMLFGGRGGWPEAR